MTFYHVKGRVEFDRVGVADGAHCDTTITTECLGLDGVAVNRGVSILYETRVYWAGLKESSSYATIQEAEDGHAACVRAACMGHYRPPKKQEAWLAISETVN